VKNLADTEMRVLIADDHPMVRGALREALTGLLGDVEIAEAGSFEDIGAALANGNSSEYSGAQGAAAGAGI
jgi:DNA-binding NarL/FixJ family response regulator